MDYSSSKCVLTTANEPDTVLGTDDLALNNQTMFLAFMHIRLVGWGDRQSILRLCI